MAATEDAEAVTTADRSPTVTRADDDTLVINWPERRELLGPDDKGIFDVVPAGRPRSFEISSELFEQLIDDINRFRGHSVQLNQVAWRISEALGDVGPEDTQHESAEGVLADLERLIAKVSS